MSDISVSLTQFIDFTLKRSGGARTNYVRNVKYSNYSPAIDYWKQLRDEIKRIHENDLSLDELDNLTNNVNERKKVNYKEAVRLYKKFFKGKEYKWFDSGNSFWSFNDELIVRSSPELGLYIDDQPHLVKLYFKGDKEQINKHNIQSTLTLMNSSIYQDDLPEDTISSVLNLKREKIYADNFVNNDLLISLEGDAAQFVHIWKNV